MHKKRGAKFYAGLPKKQVGCGALFFFWEVGSEPQLLVVKQTYKRKYWSIPGGIVEAGESPKAACKREVKEEIGLDVNPTFLSVFYVRRIGIRPEHFQFIFYGKTFTQKEDLPTLVLQKKEISEYRFVPLSEALTMVSKPLAFRIQKSYEVMRINSSQYHEFLS